ncbi:hypothetical protein LCGC14_1990220 [marine sediment metagenome]|uniref:Uncharacterized protein n=1 Tax=marine sediment metagenome TaxID=412755 RepID=A0A0F9FUD4_9ZZZZ
MPEFTFSISAAAVAKLKAVVDAQNARNGTSLTVKEWMLQLIKEKAIAEEYMANMTEFQRRNEEEAEATKNAAFGAFALSERERLLAEIDG